MSDLKAKQAELIEKRNALVARLKRIDMDFRQGLDRNIEEQALQLENEQVELEIARVTALELRNVESALDRIESALKTNAPLNA